ncbi:MAG: TRAP transporter small permease [Polaromonas sp.]|nr:TRAP transporter small permease [Polaromonas sp.]
MNMQAEQSSINAEGGVAPVVIPGPLLWLGRLVDWMVIAIGTGLIVLIFSNVVLHAFARDLAWMTELGELLMVWVTFLGGAAAAQRGTHMAIGEFLDKLDTPRRRTADAAIQLFCLGVLGVLLFYGLRIVAGSWGNVLTTLEWPMAWQYMPLPLGAALMMVFVAWDLVQTWRGVPREARYPQD